MSGRARAGLRAVVASGAESGAVNAAAIPRRGPAWAGHLRTAHSAVRLPMGPLAAQLRTGPLGAAVNLAKEKSDLTGPVQVTAKAAASAAPKASVAARALAGVKNIASASLAVSDPSRTGLALARSSAPVPATAAAPSAPTVLNGASVPSAAVMAATAATSVARPRSTAGLSGRMSPSKTGTASPTAAKARRPFPGVFPASVTVSFKSIIPTSRRPAASPATAVALAAVRPASRKISSAARSAVPTGPFGRRGRLRLTRRSPVRSVLSVASAATLVPSGSGPMMPSAVAMKRLLAENSRPGLLVSAKTVRTPTVLVRPPAALVSALALPRSAAQMSGGHPRPAALPSAVRP